MSVKDSDSLTIFTFGNNAHNFHIIEEESLDNQDPNSVENDDTQNIMCIIFKGGKIGAAYYNDGDHMVSILTTFYDEITLTELNTIQNFFMKFM